MLMVHCLSCIRLAITQRLDSRMIAEVEAGIRGQAELFVEHLCVPVGKRNCRSAQSVPIDRIGLHANDLLQLRQVETADSHAALVPSMGIQ